jgi:hypothetical protein
MPCRWLSYELIVDMLASVVAQWLSIHGNIASHSYAKTALPIVTACLYAFS